MGTPNLEARNIRLGNRITIMIAEAKLFSVNVPRNVMHC